MPLRTVLLAMKRSAASHLLLTIIFFTSGLLVNAVQLVLYCLLRPFNKTLYRNINWYLCALFLSELPFLSEWWSNLQLHIYADKDDFDKYFGKEHSFCVFDHKYDVDWIILTTFCDQIGCLGNFKGYLKKELIFLPGVGWNLFFSESLFLNRSFEADKETIKAQTADLMNFTDPVWLFIFPEGTRFTPEKHEISMDFAKDRGLPQLTHHLSPRTRGFVTTISSIGDRLGAVYDVTVSIHPDDEHEPTFMNLLNARTIEAHLYIRRIPIQEVPRTEQGAAEFLHEMFVRKDRLRSSFYGTKDYFAESGVAEHKPFVIKRRKITFAIFCFWLSVTIVPILYLLTVSYINEHYAAFSALIGLIVLVYVIMYNAVEMTKIKHCSSYGVGSKRR